jgi:hypothetical protein
MKNLCPIHIDTFNSDSSGEENRMFLSVSKDFDRSSHSGGSMESLEGSDVSRRVGGVASGTFAAC